MSVIKQYYMENNVKKMKSKSMNTIIQQARKKLIQGSVNAKADCNIFREVSDYYGSAKFGTIIGSDGICYPYLSEICGQTNKTEEEAKQWTEDFIKNRD